MDRDRLLAIFREELDDRRRALERGLLALESDHPAEDWPGVVAELFRAAHSLKGAAHSAGITAIAEVAHDLEDLFDLLRDSGEPPEPAQLRSALDSVDQLERLANGLQPAGRPAPTPQGVHGAPVGGDRGPTAPVTPRAAHETLRARVSSDDLDAAMAAARELHGSVFAAAELLEEVATGDDGVQHRATDRARHLTRAADEVRQAVQRLGLVPFADVCAGLDRIVRDVATDQGKQARLQLDTGTLELDRAVAAVLRDPLAHLVRNAVDHGLEAPDAREREGKPRQGTVAVSAALDGVELIVTVADDGAGADVSAIRSVAVRNGVEVPAADDEVGPLLFAPGFSTRPAATGVSGRGVGLDVVRTSVENVGGSVALETTAGTGMAVRMRLPLTLSTMRAVVVRTAGETVAFPAGAVEGARRLPRQGVTVASGRPMVVVDDRSVAVADLGEILGFGPASAPGGELLVLVLRTADGDAAVGVDEVVGEQEVWVRPLPRRVGAVAGALGAAVEGDGRCVLLLSPATWVRAVREQAPSHAPPSPPTTPARPRVLLAEDTATTRMLEQSILEAAGYDVVAAADGQEAWRLLERDGADVVVTDVDMPEVDGFSLCRRIRSSPRFGRLPVVLVTSLSDERDRARGLEVGADAYFVKSSFDQASLVDTIARLL